MSQWNAAAGLYKSALAKQEIGKPSQSFLDKIGLFYSILIGQSFSENVCWLSKLSTNCHYTVHT